MGAGGRLLLAAQGQQDQGQAGSGRSAGNDDVHLSRCLSTVAPREPILYADVTRGALCDPRAKGQTAEVARVFVKGYGLGVDLRTRRRVLLDTTPRRLGRFLALALVLHAPLTPLSAFSGLLRLLGRETEAPALPPVTEIPLDIIDDEGLAAPAKSPEAPAATEPA